MSHYASWSPRGGAEWFNPEGNANYRIVVLDDRGVREVDSKYTDEALFLDVFIKKEDLEGKPEKHPEEVRTWSVNVGKTESSKYGQLRKVLMKWLRKRKKELDEENYYQLLEERLGTEAVEQMLREEGELEKFERLLDEDVLEGSMKGLGLRGFQIEIATQGTGKDKTYFIKRPEGKEVLSEHKLKELRREEEERRGKRRKRERAPTAGEKALELVREEGQVKLNVIATLLDMTRDQAREWAGGQGFIASDGLIYTPDAFDRAKGKGGHEEEQPPINKVIKEKDKVVKEVAKEEGENGS